MANLGNNSTTLFVLIAVNILNFYDRNVIGALTEPIRKEFGLTDGQVGLMSSAFICCTRWSDCLWAE